MLCVATLFALPSVGPAAEGSFAGWSTNAAAVYELYQRPAFAVSSNSARSKFVHIPYLTNAVFAHFVPGSLSYQVWTNITARTNGHTMAIWSTRDHPKGWPATPPVVKWETNSMLWGMRGLTGLSPCWELEVSSGQVPITALTRRHGYTRGHSMGPDGFQTRFAGKKVWFLTTNNELVQVKIAREVVRTAPNSGRDYTIVLFKTDLPASICRLRVATATNVLARYPQFPGAPWPLFKTEQSGHVSAQLPGATVDTWKGGDSGSPDLLPLGNELIFIGGRSTSTPSPEMQADMDELCRKQGLNPAKYQMQWASLGD